MHSEEVVNSLITEWSEAGANSPNHILLKAMLKQPEFGRFFYSIEFWEKLAALAQTPDFGVSSEALAFFDGLIKCETI